MLYPCLDSLKECSGDVNYETFVVAYLFSKENLWKAKADYPWVTFIESNEIRGFAENNNLALNRVRGKYCLLLNDDTKMTMPVIRPLLNDIESLPNNVAAISPALCSATGEVQVCGRPPLRMLSIFISHYHCRFLKRWLEKEDKKYIDKVGLFKGYNLPGACMLIRTDVFRDVGWLDETYFYCPEDVALTTSLNNKGFECYVDADVHIIHYGGQSRTSYMKTATAPAQKKGEYIWLCGNNVLKKVAFLFQLYLFYSFSSLYEHIRYSFDHLEARKIAFTTYDNVLKSIGTKHTPKEIFITYYNKLKRITKVS